MNKFNHQAVSTTRLRLSLHFLDLLAHLNNLFLQLFDCLFANLQVVLHFCCALLVPIDDLLGVANSRLQVGDATLTRTFNPTLLQEKRHFLLGAGDQLLPFLCDDRHCWLRISSCHSLQVRDTSPSPLQQFHLKTQNALQTLR